MWTKDHRAVINKAFGITDPRQDITTERQLYPLTYNTQAEVDGFSIHNWEKVVQPDPLAPTLTIPAWMRMPV